MLMANNRENTFTGQLNSIVRHNLFGFISRCLRNILWCDIVVTEQGQQHPFHGGRVEVIIEVGVVGEADSPGLFGDYQHYRIRFLGQAKRGTVACSETLLDIGLLTQGKVTAGRNDLPTLYDHGTIMQWGIMVEDSEYQRRGEVRVQTGTRIDNTL